MKKVSFQRDIQNELLEWKADKWHKVLHFSGPCGVGKTTEILKFAYANYAHVLYVNLVDDIYDFMSVIENGCHLLEFEKYCIRADLKNFVNDKSTILIIDEIQTNKKVYNCIRVLDRLLDCDIVVIVSNLGTINKDFFLPAGTIEYLYMNTLSFSEFCSIFNDTVSNLYDLYLRIGGYPEVVDKYIETKSISECNKILATIINNLHSDDLYRVIKNQGTHTNFDISENIFLLYCSDILRTCNLAVKGNMQDIQYRIHLYYIADCGIAFYLSNSIELVKEVFVFNELHKLFMVKASKRKVIEDDVCFYMDSKSNLIFIIADRDKNIYEIKLDKDFVIVKKNKKIYKKLDVYFFHC